MTRFNYSNNTSLILLLLTLIVVISCYNSSINSDTGSESHFLMSCDDSCAEDLSCIQNVCTSLCVEDRDCKNYSTAATCVDIGSNSSLDADGYTRATNICDVSCKKTADCKALGKKFVCDNMVCRDQALERVEDSQAITEVRIPLEECEGCYVVNAGVWGTTPSDIYVSGYVFGGFQIECNCQNQGFVKHFDGQRWSVIYQTSEWTSVDKIRGSTAADIYTIGGEAILHYDGESMSDTMAPNNRYNSIWVADRSSVFAVGEVGTLARFDGGSWSIQQCGTSAEITGIWGDSADNIFIVAESGQTFHYDGNGCLEMENAVAGEIDGGLTGIWGTSPDNIYSISGSDHSGSPTLSASTGPGMIFHYDGSEWSLLQVAENDALSAISGASPSQIFVVGASRNTEGLPRAVVWHYDGKQWERILREGSEEAWLGDVWCSSTGQCFAVGSDNIFLSLND